MTTADLQTGLDAVIERALTQHPEIADAWYAECRRQREEGRWKTRTEGMKRAAWQSGSVQQERTLTV